MEAPPEAELATAIRQAFVAANTEVHRRAYAGDPATHGMGATALLLLTLRSSVIVAHVGDSRAYLVRDGKLRLLTKDHTRVQRMVDAGMLTEEQANEHPDAGMLERAIGHQRDVEVDISAPLELDYGDEILLCSDGLSSYVDAERIEGVVAKSIRPSEQVDELIALALARGGYDNVTVQVIRYEGGMNERKRQILTYQLAFLPLVAAVAAATAYGVDSLNRPQPLADKPAVASTGPAASAQTGVTAPVTTPQANPNKELVASLDTLRSDVEKLRKRVEELEDSRKRSGSTTSAPAAKRGDTTSQAKAPRDAATAKRPVEAKTKAAAPAKSASASPYKPATAGTQSTAALPQTATTAASQSAAAAASQAPAAGATSASTSAQGVAPVSSETKSAASSDVAARAGPDSSGPETAKP